MPRRSLASAALLTAVLLAGAITPALHAQTLLRFDPPDLTLDATLHPFGYVDLHTGTLTDTAPAHYDFKFYFIGNDRSAPGIVGWYEPTTSGYQGFAAIIANNNGYTDKFSVGGAVPGGHTFSYTAPINIGSINNATWPAGSTGYLGVMTTTDLTNFNYGWIHVSYNADQTFTIHDFALNTVANQSTAISAIPEPPAWTLLLLGLALAAFGAQLTPSPFARAK